jgi:hypothetical protein
MNEPDQRETKNIFLAEFVFYGLIDLNDGFDSKTIKYFSATDFKTVLSRVEKLELGIYGIEPWLNGDMCDVYGCDDYNKEPTDPTWYNAAFELFQSKNKDLKYSATYFIPK